MVRYTNRDNMIICPDCGSAKIFKLRIDSDCGAGIGDYEPVNPIIYYTQSEWLMDADDRPDIELFHCLECRNMW